MLDINGQAPGDNGRREWLLMRIEIRVAGFYLGHQDALGAEL